jgi:peptide deformylase
MKKSFYKPNIKTRVEKLYLKRQKEFEQIQSIIGEPFLKTVIKNYLEEIETILFEDKAKKMAIERFVKEFDKDEIMRVLNDKS